MFKIKIIKLIALFEYLVTVESSGAYIKILNALEEVHQQIFNKEERNLKKDDFYPLNNIYRIYSEVKPYDLKLGKHIMNKMQEFYDLQNEILDKNKNSNT
jgi:hypothetical protein